MADELGTVVVEPTAPTAPAAGWVSGDGTFGEGAPEEVQSLIDDKKYKTVMDVVSDLRGLEKFKGVGEHLIIPEEGDKDGWNTIYNKLGRPETHNKYTFEPDPELPFEDDLIEKWKQHSHNQGKSQKVFEEDVKFYRDMVKDIVAAEAAQQETVKADNLAALSTKYGEANVVTKITDARSIAEKLGIYQTLEEKGLASDVAVIDMLINIDAKTAEDTITTPSVPAVTETPEQELEKLTKSDELMKKFHPKHKEAHRRFIELNQIIANKRG